MDIAFHIGANCTDEDRLLKSLLKNNDILTDHNVKVPGPGKYRRLIRETIQNLNGATPAPDTRSVLMDAILDDEVPRRLVMSNANFICIPNRIFDEGIFYAQTEPKLRALTALFPEDRLDLFLGMRNPATFLVETFANSKAASFDAFMKGVRPDQIKWSDVIRRIRYAAPNSHLTVWCNEDTPLIWSQLIRAMAGVAPNARITGGYDLLAAIMSVDGMRRFVTYLRANPPKSEAHKRKIIAAFLDKYGLPDEIEEEIDLPGMTEASIQNLTDLYDDDVDFIAEMEDVTLILP